MPLVSQVCSMQCTTLSSLLRLSYADSLLISFRGGAVSALLSAAMCILGLTLLFLLIRLIFVGSELPDSQVPLLLVGYGFGASFVALFMQLGGGIYTKGADVGADMIGKVCSPYITSYVCLQWYLDLFIPW